jgi:hypothetical protein
MVWDSGCPANTLYMINLDHTRLFLHKDREFEFQGFERPYNQDIEVGQVLVLGNFEERKPSSCGLYSNISNA